MNTTENTERPKLKLNFGANPLTLNTNASTLVAGSAHKRVVVFEKPKSDIKYFFENNTKKWYFLKSNFQRHICHQFLS